MKNGKFTFVLISCLLLFYGCGEKIRPGEQKVERPEVSDVGIEAVEPVEVTRYYETSGTVRAKNTSLVSAKVMGEVKSITVKTGDRVKEGDILLTIHSPEAASRVEAAREVLGEARKARDIAGENRGLTEKTFERFRKLYQEKAVSEQEFDEVKARKEVAQLQYELSLKSLKKAEAGLSEAEAFLDHTEIRSPVDGTVAEKKIDTGSMTVPGMPLFIMEEPVYRVEVAVDEGLLSSITRGMQVDIRISALGLNIKGTVGEIVRSIDPRTRTFTVKIDLDEKIPLLRGGLYAEVKFPSGRESRLFVRESSIVTRGELKGVYAVDEQGIITLRLIKTGKGRDGMVEILSGLTSGERIIVRGVEKAVDGGVVEGFRTG